MNQKELDVTVVSMGCRLNGYESEKMAAMANEAGLKETIVINSCAVTAEAVRQTRQKIRQSHKANPAAHIIVTGCAAQIEPDRFRAMPEVSAVLGNAEKMQPAQWGRLAVSAETDKSVEDIMSVTAFTEPELYQPLVQQSRTRAYVQIQNGCDHRCTFCIIPFGRGNSRSVPIERVIREVQGLVDAGTYEVVLTGVDVTSYGPDLPGTPSLGVLVQRILHEVPKLARLRLSSIDSVEIDEILFTLITENERIAPYLHLSLQSGDNMILKRMKRRHTREQAVAFCQSVIAKRPEVAFGADIIAGFPTETEEMFQNSVDLVTECHLSYLHVFPFSPRVGTPAARMPQLDKACIKERAARLRAAGDRALASHLQRFVGATELVLVEKSATSKPTDFPAMGRLANFAEVRFEPSKDTSVTNGQVYPVTLTHQDGRALFGTINEGLTP